MNLAVFKQQLPQTTIEKTAEILGSLLLKQEQVNCPVEHIFGPGLYIRKVTLSVGTLAVGHYQKTTHMNIMLTGRCTILNVDGEEEELVAPQIIFLPPGRKVGEIHEEVTWLNVYSTDETDVEKLEDMYLDKAASPWVATAQVPLLEDTYFIDESRADFYDVCGILGFTPEQVRGMSEITTDLIEFPYGAYKVCVKDSKIEGKGLFASGNFKEGEVIAPGRLDGKRTPAGRYMNHSVLPNATVKVDDNGDVYFIALGDITGNLGGNDGEEITTDYYNTFMNTRI
jgi:quercetin dioxygenase-like cupin family protein